LKKAGADGMPLDAMKTKIADDLAPKYEAYMSRYPVGQYRDRVPRQHRGGLQTSS